MNDSATSWEASERGPRVLLWLLVVLAGATALRFFGLDLQSYWYDELFSAHYSKPAHSFSTVVELTLEDVHPPGFQLAMWLSYRVFGYTEWAGRLPSALAGTLTVWVVYLLGAELFGKRAGLYAATLATLNYYLVYFSQEARSYAFLTLLSGLTVLFFVRALRHESWGNVAGFALAALALLYSHYFGFLTLVTCGIALALYSWICADRSAGLFMRAGAALTVIVLGVLPLIPAVLGHASIDNFWITQPGPLFFVDYFAGYFGSAVLAAVMAGLLVFAAQSGIRQGDWQRFAVLLLLVWLLLGYLVPWMRGLFAQPVITDRNTIYLVLPALLLAGYGLTRLPGRWLQRGALAMLAGVSAWVLFADMQHYTRVYKHQYREMAAALDRFEPVLPVYTLKWNDTKYNVYFEQQGSELSAVDIVQLEAELQAGTAPGVFWLADGHLRPFQTDVPERYRFEELGSLKYRGTYARLYANPAAAKRLQLRAEDETYIAGPLPAVGSPAHLYVAPAAADRAEFTGAVVIEIVAADGTMLAGAVSVYDGLPVSLAVPEIAAGARIRIALPPGLAAPEAWLVGSAAAPD